jgi:hypothetical protein
LSLNEVEDQHHQQNDHQNRYHQTKNSTAHLVLTSLERLLAAFRTFIFLRQPLFPFCCIEN